MIDVIWLKAGTKQTLHPHWCKCVLVDSIFCISALTLWKKLGSIWILTVIFKEWEECESDVKEWGDVHLRDMGMLGGKQHYRRLISLEKNKLKWRPQKKKKDLYYLKYNNCKLLKNAQTHTFALSPIMTYHHRPVYLDKSLKTFQNVNSEKGGGRKNCWTCSKKC